MYMKRPVGLIMQWLWQPKPEAAKFEQCRYALFFVFTLLFTREHFPNVLFLFSVLQLSFDDIVKYAGVYGEGSSALENLQVRVHHATYH